MKYIFMVLGTFLAMILAARPITLSLSVINRQSIQKNLGFLFRPIHIKGKLVKLFWGKWTRDFFECGGTRKISLMVFILLPFNLLMFTLILTYLIMGIVSIVANNETLMLFTYEKYGFKVIMYVVILGIFTTIFSHWANIWKSPKISIKEQKEALKKLNKVLKANKNQKWYYFLWRKLRKIACSSNDKKSEYWFELSQIPKIKELVKQSSKDALLKLEYQKDNPCEFFVLDSTNNIAVFQGLFKK